jgi:Spy/CpxP family protein refolding chaperone
MTAWPVDDADRLAGRRRQSRQDVRELRYYDGHDRRAGAAKAKKRSNNRDKQRKARVGIALFWLR